MYALLTRKFKDGDLARQLIDTGNMLLVENKSHQHWDIGVYREMVHLEKTYLANY